MTQRAAFRYFTALIPAIALLSACGVLGDRDPLDAGRDALENNAYGQARIYLKNALQDDPQSAEANLLFARTMLALGDGLTAQNALDKIRGSDLVTAQEYRNLRAESLILQGKTEEAQKLLNESVDTWDVMSFALATRAALDAGDFALATSTITNGLKQYDDDAELLALKAVILLEEGRLTPAREAAASALASDAENLSALLINGQLSQLRGDDSVAEEYFDKALKTYPDSRIPLLALAAIRADQGEYDKALNLLDRADNLFTVQALSAYLRARIFYEQDDIQAAYALMQEAGAALNEHPPSLLLAGEIAMDRKNYNQAQERLTRFLRFSPGHSKGTLLLADALEQQDDNKGAAEVLKTITGRADIDTGVLTYAASVYRKAGLGEEAALMERRADVPQDEALAEQAVEASRLLSQGKLKDALAMYERVIAGGLANNALVRNNAAYVALQLGQNAKALENARAAFVLTPDDPSVRDTLGWTLLKSGGDKAQALRHLQFASGRRPADIEIRWHLAQAMIANGRAEQAKEQIGFIKPFVPPQQRAKLDEIVSGL